MNVHQNTSPQFPPVPPQAASPFQGEDKGIETQRTEDNFQ